MMAGGAPEDLIRFAQQCDEAQLRALILDLTGHYADRFHAPQPFVAGESAVPVSGKVYGASDMRNLVDASLDFWLTTGRFNTAFEARLAERIGVAHALTTNSGSSANLLALSTLTSHYFRGDALKPGDEVITVATGFPTTVNPSFQYGLVPVFVDVDIPTYNIKPEMIEAAVSERTRAIMIAHTLGNPFDLAEVMRVAEKHNLWVIEDCCDALGATYNGQNVGTFGHLGTLSFYPAHHITMGEGGAVFTDKPRLKRVVESMRDWGRDCWCAPGQDNTCGKRFARQLGTLPRGYDHKYTYGHAGYNLKITDMQAAVGLAQLDRLDGFIAARARNFAALKSAFAAFEDIFILPEATPHSQPSWFGLAALITSESGGYSPVYYMFFVLMEPWQGRGRKLAILLCYVIAIPLEIRVDTVPPVVRDSYISGANVIVQYYVGLTPFLRPLVTLAIACVIALSTLADVYRDVRADGWSQRQRFYRDAPLLPWVRRPMPPRRRS